MPDPIPESLDVFFLAMSFVMGGLIGSFLNVCIYRMPADLSVVRPGSRCPKCEKAIAWYDNMPVISWLILGAKCRNCGQPISWRYPAIEALTAVTFFLVYLKFGPVVAAPVYMLLMAGLIVVTFVDLDHWIIPDEISIGFIPVGIVCSVVGMVYEKSGLILADPIQSILGVLLGGGMLYSLDMFSRMILKKPGMGFGDVKLLAMLGAFFGVKGVLVTVVFAAILGSIIGVSLILWFKFNGNVETEKAHPPDEEHEPTLAAHYLPFGPYLVLGGIAYLFFGPELIQAYFDFFAPGMVF